VRGGHVGGEAHRSILCCRAASVQVGVRGAEVEHP
jgi:hypothetical protein